MSILLNKSSKENFELGHGLNQGEPWLHYLFNCWRETNWEFSYVFYSTQVNKY